jgi:dTDP-4-dehydrorhamnose reductase
LTFLKSIREKPYVEAVSDQFANPTYSKDLSKSTFDLLEKNPPSGTYHLASEGVCNWVEFAKEIIRLTGVEKEIKEVKSSEFPSKVKKPAFPALANTKAKELGIILPSWQDALKRYLEDFDL